jgi:hypothetical protein
MSAVLLAIYTEYRVADRVRVELVRNGFPTDRVELTAGCELGRAALEPADSAHGRLVQYFRVLFSFEDERHYAEQFAERIDCGDAIITVHPRGSSETTRATQILENGGAMQIMAHDLANQSAQCSLSKRARPWILGALALCLCMAFAGTVLSSIASTKPSPGVLRAARTALMFAALPYPCGLFISPTGRPSARSDLFSVLARRAYKPFADWE